MPFKSIERKREWGRRYAREWRAKNPERARAAGRLNAKRYRLRYRELDNAKKVIAWHLRTDEQRKKDRANRLDWEVRNAEKLRSGKKQWMAKKRHANPEAARAIWAAEQARRRAVRKSATFHGYSGEIKNFYRRAARMTAKTGIRYSVDHIWPLRGIGYSGLHVPWNLRVIPLADNVRKLNKSPLGVCF